MRWPFGKPKKFRCQMQVKKSYRNPTIGAVVTQLVDCGRCENCLTNKPTRRVKR